MSLLLEDFGEDLEIEKGYTTLSWNFVDTRSM